MDRTVRVVAMTLCCAWGVQAVAQDKWSVHPGAVTKIGKRQPADAARVTGTFTFERDDAGGIASNRFGGACLVADLTRQHIGQRACATDLDCHPVVEQRPGQASVPAPAVYEGYCLGSGERTDHKICWTRPGPQAKYCLTSKQLGGPLQPKAYALPVVEADPTGKGLPVRWRIHGCLNPDVPPPPGEQPCAVRGSTNKQANDGPILP